MPGLGALASSISTERFPVSKYCTRLIFIEEFGMVEKRHKILVVLESNSRSQERAQLPENKPSHWQLNRLKKKKNRSRHEIMAGVKPSLSGPFPRMSSFSHNDVQTKWGQDTQLCLTEVSGTKTGFVASGPPTCWHTVPSSGNTLPSSFCPSCLHFRCLYHLPGSDNTLLLRGGHFRVYKTLFKDLGHFTPTTAWPEAWGQDPKSPDS